MCRYDRMRASDQLIQVHHDIVIRKVTLRDRQIRSGMPIELSEFDQFRLTERARLFAFDALHKRLQPCPFAFALLNQLRRLHK